MRKPPGLPSPASVIVDCHHAHDPEPGPAPGRSPFHHRPERVVAEFDALLAWDPHDPRRWRLGREGVPGSARRSRRGTWVLTCPGCARNVAIGERALFAALDAVRAPRTTGVRLSLLALARAHG